MCFEGCIWGLIVSVGIYCILVAFVSIAIFFALLGVICVGTRFDMICTEVLAFSVFERDLTFSGMERDIENNTLCFHDMKNLSRRLG